MSHDIQAAWAAIEIVRNLQEPSSTWITEIPASGQVVAYATRESKKKWPIADGLISLSVGEREYTVAMEYKRPEEGTHGVLTALGQSIAYLNKGYDCAIIVVPDSYDSLDSPGSYLKEVIDSKLQGQPIGVFKYQEPDPSSLSPFQNKIQCSRAFPVRLNTNRASSIQSVETQWAHIREGSSTPDAFFKYLLTARMLNDPCSEPIIAFTPEVLSAVQRVSPGSDPIMYLSNSIGGTYHDKVWRHFWFKYIFHDGIMPIWADCIPQYTVNNETSHLFKTNGEDYSAFWVSRNDSIKNVLVARLNENLITENEAFDAFIKKVRSRAHSFREDVDSGLEHLNLLGIDGRPTSLGHKFVDTCQRIGNPHHGMPITILRAALIQNGQYGALLHYINRLSETLFRNEPLKFSDITGSGINTTIRFNSTEYLNWIENKLVTELRVMRTVSGRGGESTGNSRKPLQAELAILGRLGIIPNGGERFRSATGLVVNWSEVQQATQFNIG